MRNGGYVPFSRFVKDSITGFKERIGITFFEFSSNGGPGRIRTSDLRIRSPLLYPAELRALGKFRRDVEWSGQPDLNGRPRAPKARALTKLSYAPNLTLKNLGQYLEFGKGEVKIGSKE